MLLKSFSSDMLPEHINACCPWPPDKAQGLSRPNRTLHWLQRYTQSLVESQQKGKNDSTQHPRKQSSPEEKYVMKPASYKEQKMA
jgi:hypothetical protein